MRFFWILGVAAFLTAPAQAQDYPEYRLLKLNGAHVKWGNAAMGAGAEITYALVTAQYDFDDARNCRSVGPMAPLLEANGVNAQSFDAELEKAFAAWQAVSGAKFRRADAPENADILIGADLTKQGWAHADVKPAEGGDSVQTIERSIVCLSPAKSWKVGFGADAGAQDLRYTLTHEIGHAIGLNHASPQGQVMSFTYGEAFIDLQPGDIEGAARLYGPPEDMVIATTRSSTTAR